MEAVFVEKYVDTGDAQYSAEKAGYRNPLVAGSQLLLKPPIKAAAAERGRKIIVEHILPVALRRHRETLRDAPIGTTLNKSIETAYKFGLAPESNQPQKELQDMTYDELLASRRRSEARIAELEAEAKTIEHQAAPEPDDPGIFG